MKNKTIRNILISLALLGMLPLSAAPVVIRDDRVRDLGMTPVLGRGYSMATSTFQSTCLQNVVTTKPSFDFKYKFEELNEDGHTNNRIDWGGEVGGKKNFLFARVRAKAKVKVNRTNTTDKVWHKHDIKVELDIDQYYSSVDESKSKLSDAARSLLENKDIPGFFDSCGMYYIRGIRRNSKFVAIFTYETETNKRDTKFESELEVHVRGWAEVDVKAHYNSEFMKEVTNKNLTITVRGYGLGKDKDSSLISYDLDTFRKSIKDAFVSAQDDYVGIVDSIEVVPWVENSEFQNTVKLEQPAAGGDASTSDMVSGYEKKRILNLNGEFLSEVDRAASSFLNIYYKAKSCRRRIVMDDMDGDSISSEYQNREVINHKNGKTMKLVELEKRITKEHVAEYLDDYYQFLYGVSSTTEVDQSGKDTVKVSAMSCINDMFKAGITKKLYRLIPSCRAVEAKMSGVMSSTADNYCMPVLQ